MRLSPYTNKTTKGYIMNTKQTVMTNANNKFKSLKAQYNLWKADLSVLWAKCLRWAWKVAKGEVLVDFWKAGTQQAVLNGSLILKQGQKVLCGGGIPSLFVSHNGVTVHCVHWQGSEKATIEKFNRVIGFVTNIKGVNYV